MRKKNWQRALVASASVCVVILTVIGLGAVDSRHSTDPAGFCQQSDPGQSREMAVIPDNEDAALAKTYQLVYSVKAVNQTQRDLYIVSEEGGNRRTLANSGYDEEFCIAEYTASSSQRVVYKREENGTRKYYSVRSSGSSQVFLDQNIEQIIGIMGTSPGRLIYTKKASVGYDLFSIRLTGTGGRVTLSANLASDFAWIIGDRIVFEHIPPGEADSDIRTVKADASENRVIAGAEENESVQGQCGARVIFCRWVNNQNWLYAARADGSDDRPTRLSQFDAHCLYGGAVNDRVVYTLCQPNGQFDLVSVSITGNDTHVVDTYIDHFLGFCSNRIVYDKAAPDTQIFAIDHSGLNRAQVSFGATVAYGGILQDRVVFGNNVQGTWDLCSNNAYGTASACIRSGMYPGSDKFFLDKVSGRVVLQITGGETGKDLFSCLPGGSDWRPLSQGSQDDLYRCSTPNRFLFIRKSSGDNPADLFSVTHRGAYLRTIANQSTLDENLIWDEYLPWTPVIEYSLPAGDRSITEAGKEE